MPDNFPSPKTSWTTRIRWLSIISVMILLYFVSFRNYLLFHILAEVFSIVIAFALFSVAWFSRRNIDDRALVHLGICYLMIGFLDLLHTIGYTGMNVFRDYDFYANQLWIAARGLESLAMFSYIAFRARLNRTTFVVSFAVSGTIMILLIASIFFSDLFPVCYVEGTGQTKFKLISEYVISGILLITLIILWKRRRNYSSQIARYLLISLVATIGAEISFTFYVSNYGISNLLGHIIKILSFYYIYRAVIIVGLQNPLSLFHRRIAEQNKELMEVNATLRRIISIIGHDLRNPISSLEQSAKLVGDEQFTNDSGELRKLSRAMTSTTVRAREILESLLDWTRSQSGLLTAQSDLFQVDSIVELARESVMSSALMKDILIDKEGPDGLIVEADQNMFATVLRNILSNAIKFSPYGSRISIRLILRDDARMEMQVIDRGVGMPPEIVAGILEGRPVRSRQGTAGEHGTGLGVMIVKSFVELNGGRLIIFSEPGIGSTITTDWKTALSKQS